MLRRLLWLGTFAAGCASISQTTTQLSGQSAGQSTNSSARGTTESISSPSSAQSSNASSSSANISQGTGSPVTTVAGALLSTVAGVIALVVYLPQQRAADELKRKKFEQQRDEAAKALPPVQTTPQEGLPPPPLDGGALPVEPTPPPMPAPFPSSPEPAPIQSVEAEPPVDAMLLARAWLVANQLQLAQDLGLGAGPAIDDLAGIAGIRPEHRAHFGRVLQRNRARLLSPSLPTPRQAARLLARVGELVMADPLLRSDGASVIAER